MVIKKLRLWIKYILAWGIFNFILLSILLYNYPDCIKLSYEYELSYSDYGDVWYLQRIDSEANSRWVYSCVLEDIKAFHEEGRGLYYFKTSEGIFKLQTIPNLPDYDRIIKVNNAEVIPFESLEIENFIRMLQYRWLTIALINIAFILLLLLIATQN